MSSQRNANDSCVLLTTESNNNRGSIISGIALYYITEAGFILLNSIVCVEESQTKKRRSELFQSKWCAVKNTTEIDRYLWTGAKKDLLYYFSVPALSKCNGSIHFRRQTNQNATHHQSVFGSNWNYLLLQLTQIGIVYYIVSSFQAPFYCKDHGMPSSEHIQRNKVCDVYESRVAVVVPSTMMSSPESCFN